MLLHQLPCFPVHQFAFGGLGAALSFGGFRGDFFQLGAGIESGIFSNMRPGRRTCRSGPRVWMRKSPLENAMDDQIRIAADGGGEVGVFVEAESEVAERLGGIAGLLEPAKTEGGKKGVLGLSGELSQ